MKNDLTLQSPFIYTFPATRGIQKIKAFYQINVPAGVLVTLLNIDDAGSTMDRSQRTVNEKRAQKFADYILYNLKNDCSFIVPTVTGYIDDSKANGHTAFASAEKFCTLENTHSSLENVGALIVSMDARFKLFDGQHRSRGIAIALDEISRNPEKYKDIHLSSLYVPVMAYTDLTLEERQMFFSDINSNMAKPAASISIAYDHRDPLARFAVELAQELPFKGLVDFERNTISKKSDFLFPLKTIKDSIKSLLCLPKNYTKDDITEESKEFVRNTFNTFSRYMGWSALEFSGEPAAMYREDSILTHTVMTKAICEAAKIINSQYPSYEGVDLNKLSKLDYSRHGKDFTGRCIGEITGNMIMNQTGINLTAALLIKTVGCKLTPELKALEKSHLNIEEAELVEKTELVEEAQPEIEDPGLDMMMEEIDHNNKPLSKDETNMLRSLVVIGQGYTEKKPASITRAANNMQKTALEYADKIVSLKATEQIFKDIINHTIECEGDALSWELVKSVRGQRRLFDEAVKQLSKI